MPSALQIVGLAVVAFALWLALGAAAGLLAAGFILFAVGVTLERQKGD